MANSGLKPEWVATDESREMSRHIAPGMFKVSMATTSDENESKFEEMQERIKDLESLVKKHEAEKFNTTSTSGTQGNEQRKAQLGKWFSI